ncbi:hypothetical protein C5C45_14540 [Rathayibacter rathayi]|nr:hypothetical protein C5C34_14435 [Rathayibacter rathayi]PPF41667.1 hypothetical protein C5C08_15980 [Rathayibacter rathayi]PPF75244.1 hypothetical protein C5C14_14775 [Rathayibacter rathayi]PPG09667.1 hypothetical protein C5C11_15195 [Rathayibacter rathayi]PPG36850.1 hypothetical protein C5C20_14790 [Rathayibacter rathayi]
MSLAAASISRDVAGRRGSAGHRSRGARGSRGRRSRRRARRRRRPRRAVRADPGMRHEVVAVAAGQGRRVALHPHEGAVAVPLHLDRGLGIHVVPASGGGEHGAVAARRRGLARAVGGGCGAGRG